MLKDLFINACILIASVSIGNIIFVIPEMAAARTKILAGILAGTLGIILINFSVGINDSVILDFRNMAIILSSLYGGIIASVITSLIIGIFRLFYLDVTTASLFGVFTSVIMGVGCGVISQLKIVKWRKWLWVSLFTVFTASVSFFVLVEDKILLFNFLGPFWFGTFLLSLIMHFYTDRLLENDLLLHTFKKDAAIDFLTGLSNVREFDNVLNMAISNAQDKNISLSLLYLDIDFFKKVNDSYGHAEGDVTLRQFAEVLKRTCRSNDLIFRKGGDEFAVLLFNCTLKTALEIARRVQKAVENYPFQLNSGNTFNLTTCIGIATYPETVAEVETLCEAADKALYKAKYSGRNKIATG